MHAPPPQQRQHYPSGRPHPPPMMSSSSSASASSGKTPIAKRTRSSRGRDANDRTTASAPAPATTNIAPLPNNNTTNYNQQQPQQPPQIMRNTADEAIAKRKAELRRLQEQQGRSARITERLSQQRATAASSRAGGGATTMMVRGAVVNTTTSRFGTAVEINNITTSSSQVTARRLDESYSNNNNAATTAIGGPPAPQRTTNSAATTSTPMMAVKRTSELFPPKRSSNATSVGSSSSVRQHQSHNNSSIAPTAATTTSVASLSNNNMTMGSTNHQYQQNQPPPQKQQSTTAIPPPKQQQYQQQHQQQQPVMMTNSPIINYNYQSPSLSSVQSTSSSKYSTISTNNSSNNNITKSPKSPFGQARVTKVIPALSLNGSHTSVNTGIIGGGGGGGGIKSLVPPLSMLDPPNLVDEGTKVTAPPGGGCGGISNAKLSMKSGGGGGGGGVARTTAPTTTTTTTAAAAKLSMKSVDGAKLSMKSSVTSNNNDDNMTTPRHNDKNGEEGINSGQSTPIDTNHMEGSPPKEIACDAGTAADGGSTGVVGGGSKSKATVPDVSTTLQEAKMALSEQKVNDDTPTTTTTTTPTETDSSPPIEEKEKEENNQPPQSKKEQEKVHKKEVKEGNDSIKNGNTNNNLSRLKLDLERSEKEKLEALEEVAKLKSLLEAGGVGGSSSNNNNNGMSTIDTPNRTINTPRSGGFGVLTPRGGNTPNRFTPSRGGGRPGIPPLGWSSPRSGNSRVGSRTGSPEHGGGHPYGSMSGSGTPRVRASPLPKQLNRVISDTQLNNRAGEEGNDNDGTTTPREERVEEEFLVAAAISIPNEYGTNLASYFVRRPHVTDDSLDKEETDELAKVAINLWNNKCTHLLSREEYMKQASVFNPESLEIVAFIEADGSVFTLSGEYNACHGKVVSTMSSNGSFDEDDSNIVDKEYEWSVFDNVEDMDRALGRVSYIDVEGNERDYWLDSIYEEALTTREAYCTSMISAAFILKEVKGPLAQKREQPVSWNQTMQASQPVQMQSVPPPKSTFEGGLNTSYPPMNQQNAPQYVPQTQSQRSEPMSKVDVPINPTKNEPSTSETAATTKSVKEETKQKQSPPPPDEYEPSDSALTVMVVYLFSIFFKLTWLVIKTPFRIGSMLFTFWVVLIALRVLCLFLADDNGAWDIGAGVEYEYNMPGIY